MFQPTTAPLLLSEMGLLGLCPSLNTPVVQVEDLPVGPARAAVIVYMGEHGQMRLAVGVRSIDSDQVVIYLLQGDLDQDSSTGTALESALNFAEGMGFLFDEDVVKREGSSGRAQAFRLWQELVAGMAPGEPEESAPPPEEGLERLPQASPLALEDRPDPELLLEEVAELDANGTLTRRGSPAAGKAKAEPRAEAKATPTPLSKFRTPEKPARKARVRRAAPAAKSASRGSQIGRIPLVRRRLGAEISAKPGWLMRLLGSF